MTHWTALVAACALAGCASTGNVHARNEAAPNDAARANCVDQTASLIPHPADCLGPGHSYSRSDIDRTGRTTIGGALQELDPSITITH